jgi:hypothetical protein
VLLGFSEFFLQSLRPKHRIAIPLEHVRLLSGSLHDILHKATTFTWVLVLLELDYSRVPYIPSSCDSTTPVDRCVIRDTSSSTVGAGLRLHSAGPPTMSQSSPSP